MIHGILGCSPLPIAGTWYPDNPKTLAASVDAYLANVNLANIEEQVVAVIAPHAGTAILAQLQPTPSPLFASLPRPRRRHFTISQPPPRPCLPPNTKPTELPRKHRSRLNSLAELQNT